MQIVHQPRISYRPHRLGQLGSPISTASKDDARAIWYKIDDVISSAGNAANLYPQAQLNIQFWPRMGLLQTEFYSRRDDVLSQLPAITNWDKTIVEAKAFNDKFLALEREVLTEARRTGEAQKDPGYTPPIGPGKKEEDNTLLYVGLGVAVLLAIGLSVSLNRR